MNLNDLGVVISFVATNKVRHKLLHVGVKVAVFLMSRVVLNFVYVPRETAQRVKRD